MTSLVAMPEQPPQRREPGDAARLVSGANAYLADHLGPKHLHARIVRSHIAHGRSLTIESDDAERMPGIVRVLTARDFDDGLPPRIPLRRPDDAVAPFLQPVMASEAVRYVGEPIAVVVATDAYLAEDAADLVSADIEPLDANTDVEKEPERSDERGGTIAQVADRSGDWDTILRDADEVVTGRYRLQRQTGLPLETRGVIAEWSLTGQLHVWGPTKYVHFTRQTLATLLQVEEDDVVVHSVDVGGMFGVRGEFYPEDLLIPWAARIVDAPVAWREDRREHLLSTNHSREQVHDFELALTRDGTFLGYHTTAHVDVGAYIRPAGTRPLMMLAESLPGPYRWEAIHTSITSVPTNKTPVGNMRGPMASEATFVRERAIDRAAALIGMDPLELRRRNLVAAEQLPRAVELGPTIHGPTYDPQDYAVILDAALESFGYDRVRAEVADRRASGELVGVGIGAFLEHTGNGVEESVSVELTTEGALELKTGECDLGQGLTTMMGAVAHEQLGIARSRLRVLAGDSRTFASGRGTFGSRTAIFVANALVDAIVTLAGGVRERAAELLDVPAEELHIEPDGIRSGDELLDWKEVAPIEAPGRFEMPEPTWGFGVHLALVSVDPTTLEVRPERLLVAYDAGRLLDATAARDQLHGGTIYGVGGALYEELRFDEEGQPLTTTLAEYLLPAYSELPDVEVVLLADQPAVGNPLGLRGVGEAGVLGVGAAIANGVADAVEEVVDRSTCLPVRLDRLLDHDHSLNGASRR